MSTFDRQQEAYRVRVEAAELARSRAHPEHRANGDEAAYGSGRNGMSFTKGMLHDPSTGLVADQQDFQAFRNAINNGFIDPFTLNVQVPTDPKATIIGHFAPHQVDAAVAKVQLDGDRKPKRRKWEAPTAGTAFELEGPDAQAVTMPPAPALGSDELAYEMAEVYELALLRDERLADFRQGSNNANLQRAIENLNAATYRPASGTGRPRKTDQNGDVTAQTVFRGSSPGVEVGPYLSQFMLIGNPGLAPSDPQQVTAGLVQYGAQQIDQRVPVAKPTNYMLTFEDWLIVQNGFNTQDNAALFDPKAKRRFITTPRDLATYVHYDALYQSYLNACLILLSMGTPFDPGFDALSGGGKLSIKTGVGSDAALERQAGGFALYGGPHILTLVTEVATRALKAVRFQKFNNHLRLRPEALAARIEKAKEIQAAFPVFGNRFSDIEARMIPKTVADIRKANKKIALLPMAFQEGSPMHPTYGAGHATVAGACVTILKAFFDTGSVLVENKGGIAFKPYEHGDNAVAFVPNGDGSKLDPVQKPDLLTLEGELNKLAANISIGRNMAGVHYFSDYYDSLRLGEAIALGILEEQALTYSTDRFVLSVPTFDGAIRRIGRA